MASQGESERPQREKGEVNTHTTHTPIHWPGCMHVSVSMKAAQYNIFIIIACGIKTPGNHGSEVLELHVSSCFVGNAKDQTYSHFLCSVVNLQKWKLKKKERL